MRGLFTGGALVGIIVGIALGLMLAWYVWPVSYTEADPADLRLDLKDDYLRMIAASYSLDGDMARAMQRLGALRFADPAAQVAGLVQREQKSVYQQALIRLALDLNRPAVVLARPTFTPRPTRTRHTFNDTPTPFTLIIPTVTPTLKPLPDNSTPESPSTEPTVPPATSVPNPNAPRFQLVSKSALTCAAAGGQAHLEIDVQDASGKPLPGVGVEVNWGSGDEIFYTGLKPERGMGYAALEVKPGTYNVRLVDTAQSEVVASLQVESDAQPCPPASTRVYGWKLVFQRAAK